MKMYIQKTYKQLAYIGITLWLLVSAPTFAFAGAFGSSTIATGVKSLIQDVTSWIMIILPIITIVAIVYFAIRRALADEMDGKQWGKRITTALVCCVVGLVASALVNTVLTSYFA